MIEVKNVTKKYGKTVAVDNISFTINEGEIIGLLGPNGAGKSTTMNMLTGFIEQTEGEIIIDGYNMLKKPKKAKREIGYIIITGGITTMQGFNTIVEELFVRNATVMNLGIIGIRNNKYACSYGVIKYFVEKLDLREKKYTMYGDEKIEEIMSTRKKIGATGVLGKVFDKIFD